MIAAIVLTAAALSGFANSELEGRWSGSLQMAGRPVAMTGWVESSGDGHRATLNMPALGAMALVFEVELKERVIGFTGRVEGQPLVLEAGYDGEAYRGEWRWGGRTGPIELARTGALPPQYREVPVSFRNGDVELSGTAVLPHGPGPFAAVVWTHGSGAIGRRSRTYVREAYTLALAGVASILYDKRGVGESTGDWRSATFEDLALDAVAARAALIDFESVDADRIGVGGISQASSWIAPLACRMDSEFAFALALSATARTPAEQHLWVVESRVRAAGYGDDIVAQALDLHRRIDACQRERSDGADVVSDLAAARGETWFKSALLPSNIAPLADPVRSWMWLDPLPIWKETDVIVFGCWGALDAITNAHLSHEMLRVALGDRMTSHVLPGANHGLELLGPPPPFVAPNFHPLLLEWLREHGFAPVAQGE